MLSHGSIYNQLYLSCISMVIHYGSTIPPKEIYLRTILFIIKMLIQPQTWLLLLVEAATLTTMLSFHQVLLRIQSSQEVKLTEIRHLH